MTRRRRDVVALGAALVASLVVVASSFGQTTRPAEIQSVHDAEAGAISVRQVATGLEHPWALCFLPDGNALVTERVGMLRVLTKEGQVSAHIEGTPSVWAQGQGGLLDVNIDPDFEENRYVYLSYSKPGDDGKATTALGRGKLSEDMTKIEGFTDIFVMKPYINHDNHFGNRILFGEDGMLYLTLAERFQFEPAQNKGNHLGTVIRIHPDGSVPDDNPFAGDADAEPEIYSYGHRNIQAAAIDPRDNTLWVAEMGPLGGDELNRIEAGNNYGWPVVSNGMNYDGSDIPDHGQGTSESEFTDPVHSWSPVISPAGAAFYSGDKFPAWENRLLVGGLSAHDLVVLKIEDGKVEKESRIPLPGRIREVAVGPDGNIYVLNDPKKSDGAIWMLTPLKQ
jgi:glucose/arabinose dehydrogenase